MLISTGITDERVGNLIVVLKEAKYFEAVASQFTIIIRTNYSNPPAFCSRVVAKLLTDENHKKEWCVLFKWAEENSTLHTILFMQDKNYWRNGRSY